MTPATSLIMYFDLSCSAVHAFLIFCFFLNGQSDSHCDGIKHNSQEINSLQIQQNTNTLIHISLLHDRKKDIYMAGYKC